MWRPKVPKEIIMDEKIYMQDSYIANHVSWTIGTAFGWDFEGPHNYTVMALGLCVKWL